MAPLTSYLPLLALSLSSLPSLISAHGHVTGIVVDGVWYTGWNPEMKYQSPLPKTAGWQADNLDNGFIAPSSFGAADIICHKSAVNGNSYITAKPGSKVTFQWNTWPESHKGPILDYIAPCTNNDCTTVSKTDLKFTKFAQGGWLSGNNPGTWVTDTLVASNFSWTTTIPNVAAGQYVIRHEIIALHSAGSTNGAQAYPQCINFKIEGSGGQTLAGGTPATSFYKDSDPGILFNLYTAFTGYTIPGPALNTLARREGESRGHAREWLRGVW